jgi:hypothetical protein
MRASTVMLVAMVALIVGRWTNNKTAVDVKTVVEGAFAIIVIALLDQGETETIAKGFAWLFLAAVLLGKDTPLTGLTKAATSSKSTTKKPKPHVTIL